MVITRQHIKMKPEIKEKLVNLKDCLYVGVGIEGLVEGVIGIANNPEVIDTLNSPHLSDVGYQAVLYTIAGGAFLAKGVYNLAVSYKKIK
jgi:hypothetical protein